jgi:hypothetical protein
VGAARNASVANHVQPVAHGIDNLGELVERGPRPLKLASAMIGHNDSRGADVQSTPRVRNAHNPFETELSASLFSDILGILPVHRLVEHHTEILADRNRNVRTFCHIVLQLRQLRRNVADGMDGFEPPGLLDRQAYYCKAFQNHSPARAMMASKMSISGRTCGLGIVRQSTGRQSLWWPRRLSSIQ